MATTTESLNIVTGLISAGIVPAVLYFLRSYHDEIKKVKDDIKTIEATMISKDELRDKIADSLKPVKDSIYDIKDMLGKLIEVKIRS